MKHIVALSVKQPAKAALWQEVVCSVAVALQSLFNFAGGGFPFTDFIVDKCDLPQPE